MLASLALAFFLVSLPTNLQAHSGRTDANGGHNCNVGACAGTYHYHNGGSGGGGYTPPSTPNYVQLGTEAGKSHAQRETENIRTTTINSGYQNGYSAGQSGLSQGYVSPPSTICNTDFTFEAGTNETYKTWYKSGWQSECNRIATSVYQANYDEGYSAGTKAKVASAATVASETPASASNNDWIWLAVIGGFVGVPFLIGLANKSKGQNGG